MIEYTIGLVFKNYPPKKVIMYHMTTRESAMKIMQGGFDPRKARSKAFGEESMCLLKSWMYYNMLLKAIILALFFAW
jgi:hypothetical protein